MPQAMHSFQLGSKLCMPLTPLKSFAFRLVSAAVWLGAASTGHAAELQLFGLNLSQASVAEFRAAAAQAGAVAKGRRGPAELFQVERLGLPGVRTLEVTPWRDRVMAAQYALDDRTAEEALRKMLLTKYGPPSGGSHFGRPGDFGAQYIGDGSYVWQFDNGMQLVFKKPFSLSEASTLSYLNAKLLAEAEALAKRADDKDVRAKVGATSSAF